MNTQVSRALTVFFLLAAFLRHAVAQEDVPALVQKIQPGTVMILTYDIHGKELGQGSGFFINEKGDVITNRHVLVGAARAEVRTSGGKVYPVKKIVAEDEAGDLVRVSVDIPREWVQHLSLSTSMPAVGEKVVVIGNPLGLEQTVSDGIVSATREVPGFGNIIQITAPLSSGSSGSPVVNLRGEVIGVATFIVTEGQNLNFAVPAERVARLAPGPGETLAEWAAGTREEWVALAEVASRKGLASLSAGDYEVALSYFELAVAIDPRDAETWFRIGVCRAELGRYKEAMGAFTEAIRINPDDAEAHYNLGAAYQDLGLHQEAIASYKEAIRINPDYGEAYLGLAVAAYKLAIRINPDDAEAHYNLGLVYLITGDRDSALDEYKILRELDRDMANKLFNLIYK